MILVVSEAATVDLKEAFDYISKDSPTAAETFSLLSSALFRGRQLTLKNGLRVRAWSMPPYCVYHRVQEGELHILRVYHQARQPIERRRRE